MPTPRENENEKDFINRCIPIMINEGKDPDQAYAICKSIWDNSNKNEMKTIELTVDDINYDGVTAISLVEMPAIEENFMVFNKSPKNNFTFAKADFERRIITGPALIANKLIYRIDPFTGEEYNVFFSRETIRKISEMFFINNNISNVTLEHNLNVNGITIVESWIVDDPNMDKSKLLGYDLTTGSWMITMKINNDEVWNNFIKKGKVSGFSIEGYFTSKLDKYSKQEEKDENLNENEQLTEEELKNKEIIERIKEIINNFENKN